MENLWTYADLSRYLRRSVSALRKDVMRGSIPCVKLGTGKNAAVRFIPEEIRRGLKRSPIRR